MSTRIARFPALLLMLIFLAALALTGFNLSAALPRAQWGAALASPDIDNIQQMLFHYSLLPRLAISLLVGAGLGLVGVLFQQVLPPLGTQLHDKPGNQGAEQGGTRGDNGQGRRVHNTGRLKNMSEAHVGLGIMQERARRINAVLSVESQPHQGTTVTLVLPQHRRTAS